MMNKIFPMAAIIKFLYTHISDYKPTFSEHADTVLSNMLKYHNIKIYKFKINISMGLCKEKE